MQYFSIWVKAAKSLLLIYYQCTFSDSAVVLKQQSQMLLEQWIWTDSSCNDFFLLPERGGCVMRYLVQPVDGLQERTKLLVFHTWAPLRWSGSDTEHWSVGSGMAHPAQQWAVPDRSESPVQTSVPPVGISGSPALSCCQFLWLIPTEALCCGASIHARVGTRRAGLCSYFSHWLTVTSDKSLVRYLPISSYLMRLMAIKTLQNLWTH